MSNGDLPIVDRVRVVESGQAISHASEVRRTNVLFRVAGNTKQGYFNLSFLTLF